MFPFDVKSKRSVRWDVSRDVTVESGREEGRDFSELRNVNFLSIGSTFIQCKFDRCKPRNASFGAGKVQSIYVDCTFDGSKFKRIGLGLARFERCSFLNVEIEGLFAHAAEFVDCSFSGVLRRSVFFGRLSGVYEQDANALGRGHNEIRGNDFTGMRLIDVDFRRGVDLSAQRLPVGEDCLYLPHAAERLALLRQRYLQCPDLHKRQRVFEFIKDAEREILDGQSDLFLCKDSEATMDSAIVDAIWHELQAMQ